MNAAAFRRFLHAMGACESALTWVANRDAADAWQNCPHGPWMGWLIRAIRDPDSVARRSLVAVEVNMAELSMPFYRSYGRDDAPLRVMIDAAHRFEHGETNWAELRASAAQITPKEVLPLDTNVPDLLAHAVARIGRGNEGALACTFQLLAAAHAWCFGERYREIVAHNAANLIRLRFPFCPLPVSGAVHLPPTQQPRSTPWPTNSTPTPGPC